MVCFMKFMIENMFTLLFPIVSWSYLCRKAKVENPASLSSTLDKKECVEIFLAARADVQHFILRDLPDDTAEKLLETATTFEDGMVILFSKVRQNWGQQIAFCVLYRKANQLRGKY